MNRKITQTTIAKMGNTDLIVDSKQQKDHFGGPEKPIRNPMVDLMSPEVISPTNTSDDSYVEVRQGGSKEVVVSSTATGVLLGNNTESVASDGVLYNIRAPRKLSSQMIAFSNSRHRASGAGLDALVNEGNPDAQPGNGGGDGDGELEMGAIYVDQEEEGFQQTTIDLCSPVKKPSFLFSRGLTSAEAAKLLQRFGRNELPEKSIPKWYLFVSQLWQPMPLMIWAAIIIEAAIQNWIDFGILMFIQFANASIGFYETTKAGDAVAALKKSLKPQATCKRNGEWKIIDGGELVPGDLVLLAAGSAIPADCRVNEGQVEVDQAALTGESLPVTMYQNFSVKMGSTVVRGEQEGTVEHTGPNTFLGKTAALLGGDTEYSNFQVVLMTIVKILVVLSLTLCSIVLIYLSIKADFVEALSFTIVLLVASIPMAIEIVTTTTLALGSKELSKDGAIVKRLAAIEDLAAMSILCSDKTGTLTKNIMEIQEETPIYLEGENQYSLLRYAAMAAKWHEPPRDALDSLTLGSADLASLDVVEQMEFMPFDPIVKRTQGTLRDTTTGEVFWTSKGAPHVILQLIKSSAENLNLDPDELAAFERELEAITFTVEGDVQRLGLRGIRCLAVAKTTTCSTLAVAKANGALVSGAPNAVARGTKWQYLGLLTFLDPPRDDTKETIAQAKEFGLNVKMITGDHLLIARETSRVLDMGDYIKSSEGLPMLDPVTKEKPANLSDNYGDCCLAVDGFAQVFPEHKYLIVECLREMGYKVGMTGDGVNDAPALKRADVGVAVQGATDAARAAADIVLTKPGLSTIVKGIVVARQIFVRIRNFLTYRIAATLQLLIFFFIAVLAFEPIKYMPDNWETNPDFPDNEWPHFFALPVLMLMLITLLNDGTLIAIGYDNAVARQEPEQWNLPALFLVSSVLAFVALVSSLIILVVALDSWNEGSLFQLLGLGGLSYGQITTMVYLKVSISDFLTLFSSRTGKDFFWTSRPAPILLGAGCLALSISTILAVVWPESSPDGIYTLGLGRREPYTLTLWIWLYCLFWWVVQDFAKVGCFHLMIKYNWFQYNNTGKLEFPQSTLEYIKKHKQEDLNSAAH